MQVLLFTEKNFFLIKKRGQFELIPTILFCAATFVRKKRHFSLLSELNCLFCDSGRLGNDC